MELAPGCRRAFQISQKGRESEIGKESARETGYGNIRSLQGSPKKGILDRADALFDPP